MHIDMHYYGTFALARLAGIKHEDALVAATAAQFVDDSAEHEKIPVGDALFQSEITTRHFGVLELKDLNDPADQISVWVPFHFLPGGEGSTLTQKLVCRMDSKIAQQMVERYVEKAPGELFGRQLMGICAHVYADTFAHYGFSGVSSRRNLVVGDSIELLNTDNVPALRDYRLGFLKKWLPPSGVRNIRSFFSGMAEEATDDEKPGALGHGAVAIYPDEPYLQYSYQYEHPDLVTEGPSQVLHDNPKTYLLGCEKLHGMFSQFRESWKGEISDDESLRVFADVKGQIQDILGFEAGKHERARKWQEQAKNLWGFEIPDYPGEAWKADFRKGKPEEIARTDVHRFFRAAAYHKFFVVRELLPENGVFVA